MTANDDTEAGDQPTVAAESDATTVVPPPTEAAPELAWSQEVPETAPLIRPWRSVWVLAGVGVLCAVRLGLDQLGVHDQVGRPGGRRIGR